MGYTIADPAQQSIQMESCDSLALGLRRSAMDCAGAAQVFPHRRFNRATACEAYDAIRKPGFTGQPTRNRDCTK